jgi:serine phosphatase RsbU (regulator of sigma subunit)
MNLKVKFVHRDFLIMRLSFIVSAKSVSLLSFLLLFGIIVGQRPQLSKSNNDTTFANSLITLADSLYRDNKFDDALLASNDALAACEKVGNFDGMALALNRIGSIYRIKGDYGKSLNYFFLSLEHYQNLSDQHGIASTFNHIGSVYRQQGNYPGGLKHLFNSLKIYRQIGDTTGLADVYNNIGIVYFYQKDYDKALDYYLKSLEIERKYNDELGISISYINIGEIHQIRGEYKTALDYYLKALVLSKKYNDADGVGILFKEIGSIYTHMNDLYLAKTYLYMGLEIFEGLKDKYRIAECLIAIGFLAEKEGNTSKAINSYTKALENAQSSLSMELIAEANKLLSEVYDRMKLTDRAYFHYRQYIAARDSLFNEENTKKTVQAEMLFEFEKQLGEAAIGQAKKDAIAEELNRRQALIRNVLITALVSLIMVVSIIYSAYKSKNKANIQLAQQQHQILEKNEELMQQQEEILAQRDEIEIKNKILEESRKIIEAKNDRIISSIEYAQTIQQAILPNEEDLKRFFPDHMVFFLPKDIVSGDFYWFTSLGDLLFIAVIDCTGHGVPGSFMSLIGNIILNQVVNEWQTRDPAFILQLVHNQVRKALKQDQAIEKAHASMDICLVSMDLISRKGTFTGARRPLYLVKNGVVERIAGDPRPVGGFQKEHQRVFTNHSLDFTDTTWLYLTTDGYIDQMDSSSTKFGPQKFIQLLEELHEQPMGKQKLALQEAFDHHKGKHEQIDDICVLGLKI